MGQKSKWVLVVPFLCFSLASWLFIENEIDLRIQFDRSKEQWREGDYREAIQGYRVILETAPESKFSCEALWEIATIYYYNVYDISNALYYFERLIGSFPESARAVDSRIKLAEIYEFELNEAPKALEHLAVVLNSDSSKLRRLEAKFRWADVQFKLNEFDAALEAFKETVRQAEGEHLAEKSLVRVGTILQVKKQYQAAVKTFEGVLQGEPCSNCRLQAQLGLIESYELMDQIGRAIEVARRIDPALYPDKMRARLIARLEEKQRYYGPEVWAGR